MKKLLLVGFIACIFFNARAQKLEVTLHANSTLSHFTGSSAVKESAIQEGYAGPDSNHTVNPYGKKYAVGFDIGGQAQLVTKYGFIAGVGAGYELLRSRTSITTVYPAVYYTTIFPFTNYAVYYGDNATGAVTLNSSFVNLSPYIGYRVKLKTISFDLLPGAEFAITTSVKERGVAYVANRTYNYPTSYSRRKIPVDTRLKFGLIANYQNITINFAYAHGLSNYNHDITNPTPNIKSELFRLGIGCRI